MLEGRGAGMAAPAASVYGGAAAAPVACKATYIAYNHGAQAPWMVAGRMDSNGSSLADIWGGVGFSNVYTRVIIKKRRPQQASGGKAPKPAKGGCGPLC
jgi:hypothetical protein